MGWGSPNGWDGGGGGVLGDIGRGDIGDAGSGISAGFSNNRVQDGDYDGFVTDDILGNDPPGDPGNPAPDNTADRVKKINELFGVGTSTSARNTRANFQSSMDRYKQRFLESAARQSWGGAAQAQTQTAQQQAGAGFGIEGSSVADRSQLDTATRLAEQVTGQQARADSQMRGLERQRNDTRLRLAREVIGGGDWNTAYDDAQMNLDQTDAALRGLFMETLGNQASDMAAMAG